MSAQEKLSKAGKFLSCVLRHNPANVSAPMDPHGWVPVAWFAGLQEPRSPLSAAFIERVVNEDHKGRFEFNADKTAVRARQGHSIDVDAEQTPVLLGNVPDRLYHGTSELRLPGIRELGLLPMQRQHVHLTESLETACLTGMRKNGPLALLRVNVPALRAELPDLQFWRSNNNVWLALRIPPKFLVELA